MDSITKRTIEKLAALYPKHAITLHNQFLDGSLKRSCGIVPNDWNGARVTVIGKWWSGASDVVINVSR